jgi:hypothetical protein
MDPLGNVSRAKRVTMGKSANRGRLAAIAVIALALAIIGGWWITTRPMGQDRAVAIARDYFTSTDAHGAGSAVSDMAVTVDGLYRVNGRDAWQIVVSGEITEAGDTHPTYFSAMWLLIDASTGAVTVTAQG